MTGYPKNITENLIIPEASRERFLDFKNIEKSDRWFENGIMLAGISSITPGYFVHRRQCRHHLVVFCTGGKLDFRSNEISGSLKKGDLLFLPAGDLHHYETDTELTMVWFHLDPAHPRWRYLSARRPVHRVSGCLNEIAGLSEIAYSETRRLNEKTNKVSLELCRLILALVDREMEPESSSNQIQIQYKLEAVWCTVGLDLKKKWTIDSLAKIAAMSRSHFHALVKQYYGNGPMEIVRSMKIDHAKTLMLHTDHNLDRIAEMIGYDSAFSFSRAFKKVTGISPVRFRKS